MPIPRIKFVAACRWRKPAMPGLRQMVDGLAGKCLSGEKLRATPRLAVPDAALARQA